MVIMVTEAYPPRLRVACLRSPACTMYARGGGCPTPQGPGVHQVVVVVAGMQHGKTGQQTKKLIK